MADQTTTDDTPVTEFVDLAIDRIDGVHGPANGTPFLLLKSLDPAGSTTAGTGAATLVSDSSEPAGSATVHDTDTTAGEVEKASGMTVADLGSLLVTPVNKADGAVLTAEAMSAGSMEAPGSPEWEAMDAAALTAMASVLARMSKAIDCARDRELAESAAGAEMDYSDVWDLEDAACAVDFATGILARMSFTEAVEAEGGADDEAVVKAGKVLSAANETKIRNARNALTDVLGDGDVSEEDNVDKATVETIVDERLEAIVAAGSALKAEGDEAAATEGEAEPTPEGTEAAPPAAATENEPEAGGAAAPAAGTEDAPEPAAEPEGVSKATEESDVLKSMLEDVVKGALAPLTERITSLEGQPAGGGPFLHTEGRHDLPQSVEDVRKALEQETDPARKADLATTIAQATLAEAYRKGTAPVVTG